MNNIDFESIEKKHNELINIAKKYMSSMDDYEHNLSHTLDVVLYVKELVKLLNTDLDVDACLIGAYWHDVGRTVIDKGHEQVSADMLKECMQKLNYDEKFIDKCYKAIVNHKHNMIPETNEGFVVKDADKIAFIGPGRWNECLTHHQSLDSIIDNLHLVRNEYLHFNESKELFDREIVKLFTYIYKNYLK